jgi:hypothetical protein
MTNWNSTLLLAGVVAACVASVQGEDKPAGEPKKGGKS